MRACVGINCTKRADTLQCPMCLKNNFKERFFCSQDCFKKSWKTHRSLHLTANSFLEFPFSGKLRPHYPLSLTRAVPANISRPDYARSGIPHSEQYGYKTIKILSTDEQNSMRTVCKLARQVLDAAAAAIKPGISTDQLDQIVHEECIKRNAYPSPLNYNFFPKSVCTSVNEVICHGIPDQRKLQEGDIVNLDVTLYYNGFHGDLNETYHVGNKATADVVNLVETARECLAAAIAQVKPGMAFREIGSIIESHANKQGCSVIRTYCGHGINQMFHCAPIIPHYAKNKAKGFIKPGMCFTIEPMVALGRHQDILWPDEWTAATKDGSWSAQFEHTILVNENGCEILTERTADSPGGAISRLT